MKKMTRLTAALMVLVMVAGMTTSAFASSPRRSGRRDRSAPPTYTLSYNANAGDIGSVPANVSVSAGSNVTVSGTPTRANHTFTGWNTVADGKGTAYKNNDTFALNADTTLYAQWQSAQVRLQATLTNYTVTYNAGGGIVDPGSATVAENTVVKAATPVRDGYNFLGWSGSNGQTYRAGADITVTGNITLTAQWEAKVVNYTVTYNAGGGTVNPGSATVAENTVVKAAAPVRDGYNFLGWSGSDGRTYRAGADITVTGNMTLTAQWEQIKVTYVLSYYPGYGSNVPETVTYDAGTRVILSKVLSREGYTFKGWNTAAGGGGTAYDNGDNLVMNDTVDLYAQWELLQNYTLTYNANQGNVGSVPAETRVASGTTLTVGGAPTRSGYTFTGWNTAADGKGTAYANGSTIKMDAHVTLYAQWKPSLAAPTFAVAADTTAHVIVGESYDLSKFISNLTPSGATLEFYNNNTAAEGSKLAGSTVTPTGGINSYWVRAVNGSGDDAVVGTQWVKLTVQADQRPVVEVDGSVKNNPVEVKANQTINLASFVKVENYPKDATLRFYTDKNNKNSEVSQNYKVTRDVTIYVQAEYTIPNENARLRSSGTTVLSDFVTFDIGVLSVTQINGTFPADTTTGVPINTSVTITFDDNVAAASGHSLNDIVIQKNGTGGNLATGVSALDKVVTLTHANFETNTRYVVTIPAGTVDGIAAEYQFEFTTVANSVSSTTPVDSASGVAVTAPVKITFSENVAAASGRSLNDIVIRKNGTGGNLATGVSALDKVVTLTHANFETNTQYVVTIPAGTIDGIAGVSSFSFTTVAASNSVSDNNFSSLSGHAPVAGSMMLTFSSGITAGNLNDIKLVRTSSSSEVSISKNVNGNMLTLGFNSTLVNGQQYKLTVPTTAVPALAADYVFTFTTASSANQATNTSLDGILGRAPVSRDITLTFASNISAGVLNNITLVKTSNGSEITTSKTVSGRILTISFSGSLEYNTAYRLTIPTTAVPAMSGNYILNFTTATSNNQMTGRGTLKSVSRSVEVESANGVKYVSEFGYLEDDDGIIDIRTSNGDATIVPPGKTMYYPLLKPSFDGNLTYDDIVIKSDAVKSANTTASYQLGKSEIASIKILYKKYTINGGGSKYGYFLSIATRETTSTAARDFAADITIRKSSGTDSTDGGRSYAFNYKVGAAFAVQYPTAYDYNILSNYQIFDLRDEEDEQTFDFDKISGAYYEVEVNSQNRMLLKADTKYNSAIAARYPAANIDFFNGYGASFNRIGELRIPAERGTHIYLIESDNRLSKVSNATYDSGEECWVVKTRTLGYYAISDRELDISSSSSTAPSTAPEQPSPAPSSQPPGTGGIPNVKPNPGTGVKA